MFHKLPLKIATAVLAATSIALPAGAQDIKFPVSLENLAAKAKETVDVTLDGPMLKWASKFMDKDKEDDAEAKRIIQNLKGIYVRSYEFEKEGEYSLSVVEEIRSQLQGPVWQHMVGVRSKKEGDNADVYVKMENGQVNGLVVIAADPHELTIVNLVGLIDPDQISGLSGEFGIPKMTGKPHAQKGK